MFIPIKEVLMKVIAMSRNDMGIAQYNNVTNIAYNSGAGTYTITYGSNQTVTLSQALNTIHIMMS